MINEISRPNGIFVVNTDSASIECTGKQNALDNVMSKQWVKHGARRSNRNKRARRGRDDGEDLFSLLLSAPWQISVVAAVVVFVVMRWIVPAQFNSPFSAPLAHAVSGRGCPEFCVNGIPLLLGHPVLELDGKPV